MIRVGIGGWTYAPWRGTFYPAGLPHAQELAHASRQVSTIEINATFYGPQKPATFRRWAEQVPDDFVFALKGPRAAVNRRVLAEAGPAVERFFASGVAELGPKLGPILWQLAPTKAFEEGDLAAFLELLPRMGGDRPLRHAIEVRHESFRDRRFIDLARRHQVAIVLADAANYPSIADVTADFIYARLQRSTETVPTGYGPQALEVWAARFQELAEGGVPSDLPPLADALFARKPRKCFVYMINGAKIRAPYAARGLLKQLAAAVSA